MFRLLLLMPLAAALAGCVTTGTGTEVTTSTGTQVVNEAKPASDANTSTVLLHTSFHDISCNGVNMTLAQRNAEGRWVFHKAVQLKSMFDPPATPSQIKLAPGEYGIAGVGCNARRRGFATKVAQRPNVWTGAPLIYEGVFATFTVLPNEVVDVGSLRHTTGGEGLFAAPPRVLNIGVAPMPEETLRALAEKDPEVYRRRAPRPMKSMVRSI